MPDNPALPAVSCVFDAINTGNLAVIDDLVTDDFVDHGNPVPVPPGPQGTSRPSASSTRY